MDLHETCYMCDAMKTSREHVPPLCFFPEISEIGKDLRRNLITVPACDEHNLKKSKDDEFFRSVILMSAAQASDIGRHQFLGKFLRAVKRMPHVYSSFFTDRGEVAHHAQHAIQVDRDRFDVCIDHMVRAIFFHNFQRKWRLPVAIESPDFCIDTAHGNVVQIGRTVRVVELSRQFLGAQPVLGDNPDVFKYRLHFDEKDEVYVFAAILYNSFEVFTYSSKSI